VVSPKSGPKDPPLVQPPLGPPSHSLKDIPKAREEKKNHSRKPQMGKSISVILGLEQVESFKYIEITFSQSKSRDSYIYY